MMQLPTVLVVDDELRSVEVLLCDQRMPEMTGVEFLKSVRARWPDTVRMIISGYTDADDIISGINDAGIYQYVTKPWQPEALILTIKNAVRLYRLQRENELLAVELKMSATRAERVVAARRQELKQQYHHDDGIFRATDSPLNEVCARLLRVAPFDVSVLVSGESGTGKELVARALHYNSLRWNKPFVVENCAAMPDELLESELFGHKRGAFTGAVEDHTGLFERADGGTVFLDEIGEISPAFQAKLLRVLQEGEIRPVGRGASRKVDVRVIAATNRVLEQEVREGRFREDLYYRLAAVTIHVPALRDRPMDIPIIARMLLEKAQKQFGKSVEGLTDEALACMEAYHWPGNVRELQNEIQHLLVMGPENGPLGAELLSRRILRAAPEDEAEDVAMLVGLEGPLKERIEQLEARILKETLIRHKWNKSRAAKELGLSRVGLRAKLERYGLEKIEPIDLRSRSKAAS